MSGTALHSLQKHAVCSLLALRCAAMSFDNCTHAQKVSVICGRSVFFFQFWHRLVGALVPASAVLSHLLLEQLLVAAWQDLARLSA